MSQQPASSFQEEVERAIPCLQQANAVAIPLVLSDVDREVLDSFQVATQDQFDAYDLIQGVLEKDLILFLSTLGNNSFDAIVHTGKLIASLAEGVRMGFGFESAWTMVRTHIPKSTYDIARWHPDGSYFDTARKAHKFVATLKGRKTRFGEAVDVELFEQLAREEHNAELRFKQHQDIDIFDLEVQEIRKRVEKIVCEEYIGGLYDGAIYRVGDANAKIHSEPPTHEARIFMSVVPGTREEIREWQAT